MSDIEQLILKSQKGDKSALETLLEQNAGLIWSVVKRFFGRGVEPEDLYQLGCLGFIKAVEGFDINFGTQFSTYAVPKISGEIRRFIRDDGAIKVSRNIKEQALTIKTAVSKLSNTLGRDPTITEIASYTGLSAEEIAIAENATATVESMQQQYGDDGFSLESVLADTTAEERMVESIILKQALGRLEQRSALVIKLRYYHCMTQEQIARVLSVSQVQVSRIEKKALEKMREFLN